MNYIKKDVEEATYPAIRIAIYYLTKEAICASTKAVTYAATYESTRFDALDITYDVVKIKIE